MKDKRYMSGRSKGLWLSGAASLLIFFSDQALSQTATPSPAQSATPAPTENTPTPSPTPAPSENAPASPAAGANVLPQTNVQAPKQAAKPAKPKPQVTVARQAAPTAPVQAPLSPEAQLAGRNSVFDQARSSIYTSVGTASDAVTHQNITDLPQGTDTTVEKVL